MGTPGAGCGCGYPDWVDDTAVRFSNAIMARLGETGRSFPEQCAELAALPMWLVAEVGGVRVGIVHGDAESHTYSDCDAQPYTHADGNAESDAHSDSDGHGDSDADSDAYAHCDAEPDADSDRDSKPDSHADRDRSGERR